MLLRRSALANVEYALAIAGVARPMRRERALAALERARLAHLAHVPARVLSGGEQQLLAIARALATGPEILILDEPTSNLDPAATTAIESLVGAVRAEGTRVLLITHDLGQVRRLADEVAFLHRGRIVERTPAPRCFSLSRKRPRRRPSCAARSSSSGSRSRPQFGLSKRREFIERDQLGLVLRGRLGGAWGLAPVQPASGAGGSAAAALPAAGGSVRRSGERHAPFGGSRAEQVGPGRWPERVRARRRQPAAERARPSWSSTSR